MNITLQVMAFPSTHVLPAHKESGRYKRGDIINIHRTQDVPESPSPNVRSVFIRIIQVPIVVIQKAKQLMQQQMDDDDDIILIRKRLFNIDPQSLPNVIQQELAIERQVTVTWTQAKPYLLNMKTGLPVTDGDID